jgi:hypothetical protein
MTSLSQFITGVLLLLAIVYAITNVWRYLILVRILGRIQLLELVALTNLLRRTSRTGVILKDFLVWYGVGGLALVLVALIDPQLRSYAFAPAFLLAVSAVQLYQLIPVTVLYLAPSRTETVAFQKKAARLFYPFRTASMLATGNASVDIEIADCNFRVDGVAGWQRNVFSAIEKMPLIIFDLRWVIPRMKDRSPGAILKTDPVSEEWAYLCRERYFFKTIILADETITWKSIICAMQDSLPLFGERPAVVTEAKRAISFVESMSMVDGPGLPTRDRGTFSLMTVVDITSDSGGPAFLISDSFTAREDSHSATWRNESQMIEFAYPFNWKEHYHKTDRSIIACSFVNPEHLNLQPGLQESISISVHEVPENQSTPTEDDLRNYMLQNVIAQQLSLVEWGMLSLGRSIPAIWCHIRGGSFPVYVQEMKVIFVRAGVEIVFTYHARAFQYIL